MLVLRCLQGTKWGPKVTAIEEAQDLRVLSLDDLLRKLTTHELTLYKAGESDITPSMKNLALKAMKDQDPQVKLKKVMFRKVHLP